ncbi:MAG TPA: hypothetical protein VG963_06645 [Polyangiaceae bacterium]|nr:hypothetical protein [Polyangiaceae bacterium]
MAIADLIQSLAAHDVEFIVGGVAALLQGAPINTIDLDIVYARSPANVDRALAALAELGAVYRDDGRRLSPTRSHLESPGYKLPDAELRGLRRRTPRQANEASRSP